MATEIFAGLPEEIGVEILARVPFTFHSNLRAVCRSWRNVMSTPVFYQERKRLGISEEFVVVVEAMPPLFCQGGCKIIIYDPPTNSWARLPSIPTENKSQRYDRDSSHCVSVGGRLKVLGLVELDPGRNRKKKRPVEAVFVYNFFSCKWQRGARIPVGRCSFSSALDSANGLIYIAGGVDKENNALHEAAVYNVEQDQWNILPPMNMNTEEGYRFCRSAFVDGKFFVVSNDIECAQVYDPKTRLWTAITYHSFFDSSNAFVAAFGGLYFFRYGQVEKFHLSKQEKGLMGFYPPQLDVVWFGTVWCDKLFLCGDDYEGTIFYLFEPSSPEQEGEGKWIPVRRRKTAAELLDEVFCLTSLQI